MNKTVSIIIYSWSGEKDFLPHLFSREKDFSEGKGGRALIIFFRAEIDSHDDGGGKERTPI